MNNYILALCINYKSYDNSLNILLVSSFLSRANSKNKYILEKLMKWKWEKIIMMSNG